MSEDQHYHNDPLERFFRNKVWDYDISFNDADWMDMEERLDILERQRTSRRRRAWVAAASILLFALLAYFTYDNYTNISRITEQLNEGDVETVRPTPVDSTDRPSRPAVTDSTRNQTPPDGSRDTDGPHQILRTPPNGTLAARPPVDSGSTTDRNGARTENSGQGSVITGLPGISGEELYLAEYRCPNCTIRPPEPELGAPALSILRPASPGRGYPVEIERTTDEPIRMTGKATAASSWPRLALGMAVSPDLSTVGSIAHFDNPGYNIGVVAELILTPRLAVSAGVLQAKVNYTALGRDYKPPTGYWTNGVVPYETIAQCRLIDIPLSLKYNILNLNRSRVYATAGLHSYIMKDEDYRFVYSGDDTGLVQGWSAETGTRHWLSNASLTIGYELDIHSNWSLRLEPYLRFPLKEVGWGNVDLYSMGTFFSINYKLWNTR